MINLTKIGNVFFGLGIMVFGIQQISIGYFRPQILPGFRDWVHNYSIFAIVTGVLLVDFGLYISGLLAIKNEYKARLLLYLGFYFFILIFASHIPYLLFVYPDKLSHLGSWCVVLQGIAFSGGAFIVNANFIRTSISGKEGIFSEHFTNRILLTGRVFFCTTITLFGCSHFAYDISMMVPKWVVWQTFWSYFGGAALILAGTAILFKIYLLSVALLLALMLFLWFTFLHVPSAFKQAFNKKGNEIVSAFDALLFCGVSLLLSQAEKVNKIKYHEYIS